MYRVLIVDDSSVERKGIRRLLGKYPQEFRIYEASNGSQAWEFLQSKECDIVFTDVRMPVMDGIELLKLIKNFNKNIQTIIFSAYSDFEYTGKAIENNVDFYILKPIKVAEFYKVMDKTVERLQQIRQNQNEQDEIIKNMVRYDTQFQSVTGTDVTATVLNAIALEKWERVPLLVEELFEKLEEEKALSFLYIRQIIVAILKKLYAHVSDTKKGTIYQVVDNLNVLNNMEILKSFTLENITEICKNLMGGKTENVIQNPLVKQMLERIHQQYAEDISLDMIASDTNLSAKYLGRLFKEEMGIGFVKYLTNYRLEIAKKLLRQTNKKIAEISNEVGIHDSSYFCFVFRKRFDLSPEQYRKKEKPHENSPHSKTFE